MFWEFVHGQWVNYTQTNHYEMVSYIKPKSNHFYDLPTQTIIIIVFFFIFFPQRHNALIVAEDVENEALGDIATNFTCTTEK